MAFILMGTNSVSAKTPKVKKIKFSNVSSNKDHVQRNNEKVYSKDYAV